jgi:dihydrofolate reductase
MGRNTYEYFAPAWSVMTGAYPERINAIRKYVFSSTLTSAKWNNSVIIAGDPVPAVAELKDQDGADLVIYGYGQLTQTLLENDLVDELDIWLHPVVLGQGTPLFRPGKHKALRLIDATARPSGVVSLRYARS